jgi:membrane-anchored protein YejM (alkaline phosphatase superfamily)
MMTFLKNFLITGLPMAILMGVAYNFLYDWKLALFGAVFSGVGFGLAMAGFAAYLKNKFQKNPLTFPDGEQIIKEGVANHKNKLEAAGGYLYLTDQRLLFQPHKFNFNSQQIEIPLGEVSKAVTYSALGLLPTGIKIILKDDTERKFVVEKRKEWCNQVNQIVNQKQINFN